MWCVMAILSIGRTEFSAPLRWPVLCRSGQRCKDFARHPIELVCGLFVEMPAAEGGDGEN